MYSESILWEILAWIHFFALVLFGIYGTWGWTQSLAFALGMMVGMILYGLSAIVIYFGSLMCRIRISTYRWSVIFTGAVVSFKEVLTYSNDLEILEWQHFYTFGLFAGISFLASSLYSTWPPDVNEIVRRSAKPLED